MRILHLASTLGPTGSAHHLAHVSPVLAANGFEQVVLNLGENRPFVQRFNSANVRVETLRFRGPFDLAAFAAIRQAENDFRPDVVHVWGNTAAMAANAMRLPVVKSTSARIVVSGVSSTSLLARRIVNSAKVVRNAEPILDLHSYEPLAFESIGIPANSRVLLNVGGFDAVADPRMAASAFDILKYTLADVHLVMIGDGPDRATVERFVRSLGADDLRTHFLGTRIDVPALLKLATVVVVTHRVGGRGIALAARHAGVPVVAWNTRDLSILFRDDPDVHFVPIGDRTALASAIYRILTSEETKVPGVTHASGKTAEAAAAELHEIYRSLKT